MKRKPDDAQRVVVVVQRDVNLLDLAGPVQVFHAACGVGAPYELVFAGHVPEVVSAQGLRLSGLHPLPEIGASDLVVVPGPRLRPSGPGTELVAPAVVDWLRAAAATGARVAAICTGAAALGEAGLLDGRACTTHWGLVDAMRERYPLARVREAVLFVHDGPISTSAGISAGIDLALSLVERDHGPAAAAAVARQLVVYMRREGTAEQISPFLRYRAHLDQAVHRVQDQLAGHVDDAATLDELAALVNLSPRALRRAFAAATGVTPGEYRRELRLERAAALIAGTDLTLDVVAERCGLRDARHLRRLYTDRFGCPPSAARRTG